MRLSYIQDTLHLFPSLNFDFFMSFQSHCCLETESWRLLKLNAIVPWSRVPHLQILDICFPLWPLYCLSHDFLATLLITQDVTGSSTDTTKLHLKLEQKLIWICPLTLTEESGTWELNLKWSHLLFHSCAALHSQ